MKNTHIACDRCGHYQQVNAAWLTCAYCSEVLPSHPYFKNLAAKKNAATNKDDCAPKSKQ